MSLNRLRRDLAAIARRSSPSIHENPEVCREWRELKESEVVYSKHRRELAALDVWQLERGGRREAAARLRRALDSPGLLRGMDAVEDDMRAAWNALSATQRGQVVRKHRQLRAWWIAVHLRWMIRDARRRGMSPDETKAYIAREWARLARDGILPSLPKRPRPNATTAAPDTGSAEADTPSTP